MLYGPSASPQQQADAVMMLRRLRGVSVVQKVAVSVRQPRYSMHPLVRSVAVSLRGRQPADGDDTATFRFVTYMLIIMQRGAGLVSLGHTAQDAPDAAQLLALEAPNLAAMLKLMPQLVGAATPSSAGSMLQPEENLQRGRGCSDAHHLETALWSWAQLQLAAEAAWAALNASQQRPELPDTLSSISTLCCKLGALGRHKEEAEWARLVLEVEQRYLGPEHPSTQASMDNLSNMLDTLGRHKEAAELARQALEAWQRVLGPEHRDTLASMSNKHPAS